MGISVGLVGLGAFGSCFAPLFHNHPRVSRLALCDREPDRLAKFANLPAFRDKLKPADVYDSFEELLKSDIEAVVIITQHWLHARQSVQALEAGKHVYCAVPLMSVPDGDEILEWCDRLITTVKRTGLHFMYGETTCYRPEAMFCRRKAAEGSFGDFVYAEGEYLHDVDHGLREVTARRLGSAIGREYAEELRRRYGSVKKSPPMHYPTHSTSGPIWVMGARMERVWALPYYSRSGEEWFGDEPSNETALFKMSNGASCRISEYREIGFPGREIFRVYGTKASFEHSTWYDKNRGTQLTVEQMRDPLPPEVVEAFRGWKKIIAPDPQKLTQQELNDFGGGHGGSHAYLVHEFCEAIAEDRTPAITAWHAVRFTAAGVMAHKSAISAGEILEVPDWGDPPTGR